MGPGASTLVGAIGDVPGVRVVHRRRLDVAEPVEVDATDVVEAVRTAAGDLVVVVAGDNSIEVIPVAD